MLLSEERLNKVAVPAEGSVVPPRASRGVVAVVPSKVNADPVANALVDEAYITPLAVNEVRFVPPLVVANVPANVTAPEVAVEGVNPVVPAENVVTPSAVLEAISTKSEPFHATRDLAPERTVTPVVGPLPTIFTDWLVDVALIMTKVLL